MASGEAFDRAIQLARATPTLDVGEHLTLTEEYPVLTIDGIPTSLNKHGLFHADPGAFMKRYVAQRISLEYVRREINAQIGRVAAQRVGISHLHAEYI
jgi:predicted glycoside hydrolase/deacetylase ChbG (UPF0249 family)